MLLTFASTELFQSFGIVSLIHNVLNSGQTKKYLLFESRCKKYVLSSYWSINDFKTIIFSRLYLDRRQIYVSTVDPVPLENLFLFFYTVRETGVLSFFYHLPFVLFFFRPSYDVYVRLHFNYYLLESVKKKKKMYSSRIESFNYRIRIKKHTTVSWKTVSNF